MDEAGLTALLAAEGIRLPSDRQEAVLRGMRDLREAARRLDAACPPEAEPATIFRASEPAS